LSGFAPGIGGKTWLLHATSSRMEAMNLFMLFPLNWFLVR
jgi:hypothetical protein